MESTKKGSHNFRQISTTCFEIHPQSLGNTVKFNGNLPIRPHCFSAMSNTQNRHHFNQNYQNFSFKPQINKLPYQLYPQNHDSYNISRQQRLDRLFKDSREKISRLKDIKARNEEQYFKTLQFQPNISKMHTRGSQSNCGKENIFQRLYQDFSIRSKSFDILQNKVSNHEPFQEKKEIVSNWRQILNVQKTDLKPIHQRLKEVADYRVKLKKALLQQNSIEHPFHPCIRKSNIKSPSLRQNVVERLMKEIQKKKFRREQLNKKYQKLQNQLLTFKPKLNPYIYTDRSQNFINRLNNYEQSTKINNNENFFTPQINRVSKLLIQHIRKQQSQSQAVYRLSYYDNQQKKNKIAIMAEEHYQQYTFNPQINQISKACNAKPTVHTCVVPKTKSYSYQPSINECSRLLAKDFAKNQTQRKYKQSRMKDKIKYEQQYQELKQCTFHPRINTKNNLLSLRKKVDVNGANTYCKRLQNFTKKKQEQQQYEEKIFRWDKKYDQRMNKQKTISNS